SRSSGVVLADRRIRPPPLLTTLAGMVSIPDVPDVSAQLLADLLAVLGPLPLWGGSVIELAGELLLLLVLVVWLRVWVLARGADAKVMAVVLAVPAGAGLAWGASEVLKQALQVDRPCRLLPSFPGWAVCAAPGDWSLPSNHAAIAGALTVAVAVAAWRIGAPIATAVVLVAGPCAAVSRVLAGAHFPHDVAAGAMLGGIVAVVVILVFDRLAPRPLERLRARRRAVSLLGTARPPRRGPDR
ncbi:MAG: phosphatase PAP2 family protein, partial [Pseudonocardia sp.]|nr:phosphatase PAP2 family protein [Pseudonocardia sp.]